MDLDEPIQPPEQRPTGPTPQITPGSTGAPVFGLGSKWDTPTKRTVLVILLVATALVIWISRSIIPLLIVSGLVAYLLNPIVDLCTRLRIPRNISTIVLFILLLAGIAILPILLVPILVRQLIALSTFDVQSTAVSLLAWFNDNFNDLPETLEILGYSLPVGETLQQLQANSEQFNIIPSLAETLTYIQQLISTATNVVSRSAVIGFSVVGGIFQVFLTALVLFFLSLYMTKDVPMIRAYVENLFPISYQSEVAEVLRRMGYVWEAFLRGQLLLSIIVGFMTWAVLSLAGMPGALILGILAGALEVVPNLGPTIAMIPAVIIALIQGSTVLGISNVGFALITVGIYFIIQQLENNILVPRIIGQGVNLHPIVVICGVMVGFSIFGIVGALLAAPIIASLRVLGSYIHAKLLDYPPFLDQPMPPKRRRSFRYRRTVKGTELAQNQPVTDIAAPVEQQIVGIPSEAPPISPTDRADSVLPHSNGNSNNVAEAEIAPEIAPEKTVDDS